MFESVDPCVAGPPRHLRHQVVTMTATRHRHPGSAESDNWGAANLDSVQIHMTAEVETEWLDDVDVTEWLDDVGVVSQNVHRDASDSHCTCAVTVGYWISVICSAASECCCQCLLPVLV